MAMRQLFGIQHAVIQAPMAGVQDDRLAATVSNAGGLGSLPGAMLSGEELRDTLTRLRQATDKPFNVNFFCHQRPQRDAQRERRWQKSLSPYYDEFGVPATDLGDDAERRPFDMTAVRILQEFKPPVVSFHFGLPDEDVLSPIRSWGGKIMATATTIDEALWLESRGVDAIIAQGAEAGGHRGMFLTEDVTTQQGTFTLVPQIARMVRVPVIAAGGIADEQGVRAARALGAAGVQVGTAYLLCPETATNRLYRRVLQSESAGHTAITNVFTGRPARGVVNRLVREMGPMHPDVPPFPLAANALAPLRTRAESENNADFTPVWAGQHAAGCREQPAAELTFRLGNA